MVRNRADGLLAKRKGTRRPWHIVGCVALCSPLRGWFSCAACFSSVVTVLAVTLALISIFHSPLPIFGLLCCAAPGLAHSSGHCDPGQTGGNPLCVPAGSDQPGPQLVTSEKEDRANAYHLGLTIRSAVSRRGRRNVSCEPPGFEPAESKVRRACGRRQLP